MQISPQKIGPLDCLEIPGTDSPLCVVLFHGYGANHMDLIGLAKELGMPKGTRFVFPNGLHTIPFSAAYEGRAWFPIELDQLEKAQQGQSDGFEGMRPPGLDDSLQAAQSCIAALDTPMEHLILGGFSQGAMLTIDIAMSLPQNVKGLLLFSAGLIDRYHWSRKAELRKGQQYFQSHGRMDPVLPFAQAEKLNAIIDSAGWMGSFFPFMGGHEIPGACLNEARKALINWI